MKISRVHLVSDEELKSLARSIDFCIDRIAKNDLEKASWTLNRLKENIGETLEEEKLR